MAPKAKRARKDVYDSDSPSRSEEEYDLDLFKSSSSAFGVYEEKGLRINIRGTDDVSEVFPEHSDVQTDPDFDHLKLEGFDYDQILTFVPTKHEELSENQRRFLMKLRHVLINNMSESSDSRFEMYIHAFVDVLFNECKLDDALHLEMLPSRLKLLISDRVYAAHSDREGRKDDQLVWVLQESKHIQDTRYKNGEIQLVSALIAACQHNYNKFGEEIFPQVMYGINIRADEVTIIRTIFSREYMLSLFSGVPQRTLKVKKYPKRTGLKISSYESRCRILSLMTKLRKHALSINIGAASTS